MEEVVASPGHRGMLRGSAHDDMKGQIPVGLVLIKDGATIDQDELEEELRKWCGRRSALSPASAAPLWWKGYRKPGQQNLRRVIRQIADGEQYNVPFIDDPAILEEISEKFDADPPRPYRKKTHQGLPRRNRP